MNEPLKITLKAARVNAGMTQGEAAEKAGVTIQTLCSWENGKTEPSPLNVFGLCSIYGISVDNIFLPKKLAES